MSSVCLYTFMFINLRNSDFMKPWSIYLVISSCLSVSRDSGLFPQMIVQWSDMIHSDNVEVSMYAKSKLFEMRFS